MSDLKKDAADSPLPASRRSWLYGSTALVAAAAGAGWAWWKFQPHAVEEPALRALWEMRFETSQGGELSMAALRGRPLIVNFWATWCPPCVEELPLLDAFYRENSPKGWQVLGLAIDQPTPVRAWLQKKPLHFPVGLAGLQGTELGKSLGNAAGGLPFTVVFGANGQVIQRKMGKLEAEDLAALVA
jgi:thiol-disulfide isomerase/thioredoxin